MEGVDRTSGETVEMIGSKVVMWWDMLAQTRVTVIAKKKLLVARVEVWEMSETAQCGGDDRHPVRGEEVGGGGRRWSIKQQVPVEMKESRMTGVGLLSLLLHNFINY